MSGLGQWKLWVFVSKGIAPFCWYCHFIPLHALVIFSYVILISITILLCYSLRSCILYQLLLDFWLHMSYGMVKSSRFVLTSLCELVSAVYGCFWNILNRVWSFFNLSSVEHDQNTLATGCLVVGPSFIDKADHASSWICCSRFNYMYLLELWKSLSSVFKCGK